MGSSRLDRHHAQHPLSDGQRRKQGAARNQRAGHERRGKRTVGEIDQQLPALTHTAGREGVDIVQLHVVAGKSHAFLDVVHRCQPQPVGVHQINGKTGGVEQSVHVPLDGFEDVGFVELRGDLLPNGSQQLQRVTGLLQKLRPAGFGFGVVPVLLGFGAAALRVQTHLHCRGPVGGLLVEYPFARCGRFHRHVVCLLMVARIRVFLSHFKQQFRGNDVAADFASAGQGLLQALQCTGMVAAHHIDACQQSQCRDLQHRRSLRVCNG